MRDSYVCKYFLFVHNWIYIIVYIPVFLLKVLTNEWNLACSKWIPNNSLTLIFNNCNQHNWVKIIGSVCFAFPHCVHLPSLAHLAMALISVLPPFLLWALFAWVVSICSVLRISILLCLSYISALLRHFPWLDGILSLYKYTLKIPRHNLLMCIYISVYVCVCVCTNASSIYLFIYYIIFHFCTCSCSVHVLKPNYD